MIHAQAAIRQNAAEVNEYISGLGSWLADVHEKPAPADQPAAPHDRQEAFIAKEKGNLLFKKGRHAAALAQYSRAIALDPAPAVYHLNRAMARLKLSDHAGAITDCDACLARDAKNVKALFRRAAARAALGDIPGARADYEQSLVLDPTNTAVRAALSTLTDVAAQPQADKAPEPEWSLRLEISEVNEPRQFLAPRLR